MEKSKWHETRQAKMDELFKGKKFRIVDEFKSENPLATPLGYKIKSGYRLEQVGLPVDTVNEFVVGKSLLNTLVEKYQAVDRPEAKKRGRPKKQPLAQAKEWAARDIPNDAGPITQPGETYTNPNATQEFKG